MTQWFLITPGLKQTLIFKSGLLTSYCIDWEVFYIFFCLKEGTRKKALSSARGDWCTHDIHDVVQKGGNFTCCTIDIDSMLLLPSLLCSALLSRLNIRNATTVQ